MDAPGRRSTGWAFCPLRKRATCADAQPFALLPPSFPPPYLERPKRHVRSDPPYLSVPKVPGSGREGVTNMKLRSRLYRIRPNTSTREEDRDGRLSRQARPRTHNTYPWHVTDNTLKTKRFLPEADVNFGKPTRTFHTPLQKAGDQSNNLRPTAPHSQSIDGPVPVDPTVGQEPVERDNKGSRGAHSPGVTLEDGRKPVVPRCREHLFVQAHPSSRARKPSPNPLIMRGGGLEPTSGKTRPRLEQPGHATLREDTGLFQTYASLWEGGCGGKG